MFENLLFAALCAAVAAGIALLCFPEGEALQRLSALRAGIADGALAAKATAFLRARMPQRKQSERASRELYQALGVLRNYARAAEGAKPTTDALLEQFAQTEGVLQAAYAGSLRLLRSGREGEVGDYFASEVGEEFGRDFILLVLEWDRIDGSRLTDTILSFRTALKEARTTALTRKNEALSDLVYLPVITGALVLFMNFIYVSYFVEQRDMLAQLYF